MYAHEPGKIPVSPDTSHPRFPGIFVTFNRKIFRRGLFVRVLESINVVSRSQTLYPITYDEGKGRLTDRVRVVFALSA